ncbi:hypothetical protein QJS10_CPB04g00360 [Acorus calamus]|uniref:Amidohydrolase 3 domain-containing protein n=1 Tax=Acorus calamus TaxID=4465 RepID=A0AAV9F1Q5_ACOCL|nr:hypothetical protein QJS10_CPB04g00360 [Acorus calamus]
MAGVGFNTLTLVAAVAAAVVAALLHFNPPFLPLRRAPPADLVITNATIHTSDPSLPSAEAMAVRDDRIVGIGSHASIQGFVGRGTRVLDVGGKIVVPGFIDSHVHLISGDGATARVALRSVRSRDEFIRKVKEALKDAQKGDWILGGGWNNDVWGGDLPVACWIDDITPNNPVQGITESLAVTDGWSYGTG